MSQEKGNKNSPEAIRPQSTAFRGTADEKTKQMIDQIGGDNDQEIDLTEDINNNNRGSSVDLKVEEVKV